MRKIHSHFVIDYYSYRSGLGRWNPLLKIIFTLAALLAVIGTEDIQIAGITFLCMVVLVIKIGKVPLEEYGRLLMVPAVFIATGAIVVLLQFEEGGTLLWKWKNLILEVYITKENLKQASILVAKSFSAVSVLYMLSLSTPIGEILQELKKWHMPSIVLDLMYLIYHYIFILLEINHKQKEAAKARLGYRDWRIAIRTFAKELSNLLILSLQKSNTYFDAMEARGYCGELNFLVEKKPVTISQLLVVGLYLAVTVFLILKKWAWFLFIK